MPDYFSHDYNSRNDPKLVKLVMKHGQAGKGIFWDIVEMLYEQDGYLYMSEIDTYSYDLRTEKSVLISILKDFDLFKIKQGKIFSASILRRICVRKEKSEKAKESANARWQRVSDDANALRTQSDGNAINKSKVKEIKDKYFSHFWTMYDKKIDKEKCIKKIYSLDVETIEEILKKLPFYIQKTPDVKYRKNPLTWLNGKCWLDEIEIPKEIIYKNGQDILKERGL